MTRNATPEKQMAKLHKKLTEKMLDALSASDSAIGLLSTYPDLPNPVKEHLKKEADANPALLQAVSKFLKDNDITCLPEESEKMSELERRLKLKRSVGNVAHIDKEE